MKKKIILCGILLILIVAAMVLWRLGGNRSVRISGTTPTFYWLNIGKGVPGNG